MPGPSIYTHVQFSTDCSSSSPATALEGGALPGRIDFLTPVSILSSPHAHDNSLIHRHSGTPSCSFPHVHPSTTLWCTHPRFSHAHPTMGPAHPQHTLPSSLHAMGTPSTPFLLRCHGSDTPYAHLTSSPEGHGRHDHMLASRRNLVPSSHAAKTPCIDILLSSSHACSAHPQQSLHY